MTRAVRQYLYRFAETLERFPADEPDSKRAHKIAVDLLKAASSASYEQIADAIAVLKR